MKIEIRYQEFNNEFHADIEISKDHMKHIASDSIKVLFDEAYNIYWNFIQKEFIKNLSENKNEIL